MNKPRIALALSAALLAGAAFAEKVATVNGVVIPESRMNTVIQQLQTRGQSDTPDLRAQVKDNLITQEVLLQEAKAKKIDQSEEVRLMVEDARINITIRAFVENHVKNNPVTQADIKGKYDALMKEAQFAGKEFHSRHILLKTEAEAKAVLADLKKGKKFEDLAKQKSIDTGSGAQGGDLGWMNGNDENIAAEFRTALKELPKGKITPAPVKTQFGFHVIKMEDTRDVQKPKFDDVKQEIEQQLSNQKIQKLIGDLRAKAKVE